jgi:hypothetical protein
MANLFGIHSVGDSIVMFLRNTYPEPLRTEHPCEFRLLSSGELDNSEDLGTAVTLYMYRAVIDEHLRNHPDARKPDGTPYPLSLCLYYIFIIWADTPLAEQTITAWVMSQLHQYPILDSSTLSTSADWEDDEQIFIVPIDMSNEDLMRLWDAVTPGYRLSLPYLARVVRIYPSDVVQGEPVVATRYRYGVLEDEHEDV